MERYNELNWEYKEAELNLAIRINASRGEKSILERLSKKGIELEKVPFLRNGFWISKSKFSIGATLEYLLGLYSIQEAASQIPVTLFNELKEKKVLDACAAPGGKTVQLATIMENTGTIFALDINRRRINVLCNHLERCFVRNTIVKRANGTQVNKFKTRFDRILLDVPCSGNFATDIEWFNKRTFKDIKRNAILQRKMLREATYVLKDDGEIIYSTCSLEPEENELNIDWAIRNLDLKVQKISCFGQEGLINIFGKEIDESVRNSIRIWPSQTQGFFICKLKKMVH